MQIKELLNKRSRWCQGTFARSKTQRPVNCNSRSAVSWCLIGALNHCYRPGTPERETALVALLKALPRNCTGIPRFNDTQPFTKIKALLKRANV